MKSHVSFGTAVAGLVLLAAAARASDFESATPSKLASRSDDVIHAVVRAVRPEMGPLPGVTGSVPLRRLVLEVIDSWRGRSSAGDVIEVIVPGGTAPDGSSLMVSSSPSTEDLEGREVVAFVRRDAYGPGRHGLQSGAFGLYRVVAGRRTSIPILRGQAGSSFPLDVPLADARQAVKAAPSRAR